MLQPCTLRLSLPGTFNNPDGERRMLNVGDAGPSGENTGCVTRTAPILKHGVAVINAPSINNLQLTIDNYFPSHSSILLPSGSITQQKFP